MAQKKNQGSFSKTVLNHCLKNKERNLLPLFDKKLKELEDAGHHTLRQLSAWLQMEKLSCDVTL